jgi:hypothetical protein
MAVDVDLGLEGKPRLEPHVDEPEFPIHEVAVEEQALPLGRLDVRGLLPADVVGAARLDGREDADQPVLDAIALGDLASQLFLAHVLPEVRK